MTKRPPHQRLIWERLPRPGVYGDAELAHREALVVARLGGPQRCRCGEPATNFAIAPTDSGWYCRACLGLPPLPRKELS